MSRGFRAAFLSLFKRPPRLAAFGALAAAVACHTAWAQTAPTVSSISLNSAGADNSYGIGDEIEASITFSAVVHVFEGEVAGVQRGELHLLLAIGAATRQAQFCGGSGSTTLRFCYEVRSGDEDTDGISIGRLATALVDGVIESATGVAASRAFAAQAADATRLVDGVPPAPSTPTLNTPATGDTYGVGETIAATVTFSEAVNVIENNALGQLQLALSIGNNTRFADYATGSGTAGLVFTYVVQADDADTDGISIAAGARSLTGGGITDAVGNTAGRNFNALAQSANHKVDGASDFVGPMITNVRVSSTPRAGGAYATGEFIEITVTFNEVVQVAGNPAITLTVGATARAAAYHAGEGTTALAFRYAVQAGETDANGVGIPAGPAALAGGTIQDAAGNAADRAFARLADQPLHEVEAVAPTVVGNVSITSSPAAGNTYGAGETITAQIVFNENIVVTGAPALELAIGSARRQAVGVRAATPTTLIFSYTVVAGDLDADGIAIAAGPGSLTGGAITDAVGNAAARAFTGLPAAQPGHRVDGGADLAAPTVSAVRIISNAGVDQTYALGDAIEVEVEFSEVVHVLRGTPPQLTLSIGAKSASAAYHDGSGTNTLLFRYVVVAEDMDADGVSIGPLATALTGGAIEDAAGNAATRAHAGLAAQTAHRVEARAPRVISGGVVIASDPDPTPPDDDTYNRGDVIRLTVTFDEVVHVTTTPTNPTIPQLALTIGPATRVARFVAGSGTRTLEFHYAVQLGEVDADGISVNPNSLTGGGIEDAVGNPAMRGFAGLAADSGHMVNGGVDAVAPTIETVRVSSNPNTGAPSLTPNTYAVGDNIEVDVTFDEVVHVTGNPAIILALGNRAQGAAYHRGSGTDTLTFRYTVREGDVDTDGIGIGPGPGALSGGAIVDSAGNTAARAFAGLPRQDTHLVEAVSPTVTEVRITSSPGADNVYTIGESITGTVTFSEEIVAAGAEIELLIGDGGATPTRRVPLAPGATRRVLSFTYAVQRGDSDDGVSIGPDALVGGTIRDDAGNPAQRRFAGLQHRTGGAIDGGRDNVPPTVLSVAPTSDPGGDYVYAGGDHIDITVTFDEVVHASRNPELTLTVGAAPVQAAYHRGGGTTRLVFRHTVRSNEEDDDGIAIGAGPGALGGGDIHDSAGNPADRAFPDVGRLAGHRVDAVPPRPISPGPPLEITSDPNVGDNDPPDTYQTGDTIRVTATFDDPIQVQGTPHLTLTTDNGTRPARYQSGGGTNVLTFEYTVLPGDRDVDGISIAANALSCGRSPASAPLPCLTDLPGNPASHVVPGLAADSDHLVDGDTFPDGPFVSVVRPASSAGADETYAIGDTIEVEVHYRRTDASNRLVTWPVFVSGSPTLTLVLGSRSRPAAFARGSGTHILTFAYTVEPGDVAPNGFTYPPRGGQQLVGGTIVDAGGNNAYRGFSVGNDPGRNAASAAELARHKVDGLAPRVESVAVTSDPGADDTYKRGEEIQVVVRFDQEIRLTHTPSLTLDLAVGERQRAARLAGSTTDSLTFAYAVQDGDSDADGVSINANAIRGGEVKDIVGNDAILGGVALADQAGHKVDGVAAGAVATVTSDPGADRTYGIGDTIIVQVLLDSSLSGGAPQQLLIQVGAATQAARLVTERERLLTFEYVVQEGDSDNDGISIEADALRRGEHPAGVALAPLSNQAGHRVDAVPPGVARVTIESTPNRDQTYGPGEVIEVHVAFNEPVWVDANPRLRLSIGSRAPAATYRSGSGSATLVFRYPVQSGDFDDDGISIGANALIDGAIADGAGNILDTAGRRLQPLRVQPAHKVDAGNDDQPPSIQDLRITSTPQVGDTYAAGETIEVQVIFSEAADVVEVGTVGGQIVELERPVLELELGCSGRTVSRSARLAPEDDASDTLTFRYAVVDGDCDDDGVYIPANALTGGAIVDYSSAANEANRAHGAHQSKQKVDGVTPRPTGPPRITSRPRRAEGYGVGETITARVPFSERIYVAGQPTLRLTIGRAARNALFAGVKDDDAALEFQYVVASGDQDDDGVSIGPDALSGGTVQDAAGNAWTNRRLLALPSNAAHRVAGGSDFLPPVVTEVRFSNRPRRGTYYGPNEHIEVEAEFNERVFIVAGTPAMRLSIGANSRTAVYLTGDGTETLTFRYVVQATDSDEDGISIGPNAIFGGTLRDGAGNEAALAFVGLRQDSTRKVNQRGDQIAPFVREDGVRIASKPDNSTLAKYALGEVVRVEIRFSEVVHVSGQPSLALSIGPNIRQARYESGSGSENLTFAYTVQAGDEDNDGISIGPGPISLAGGAIRDGSGNPATRDFAALRLNERHQVDGVAPSIGSAPAVSSAPERDDTYRIGEAIELRVTFDDEVQATGNPTIALRVGAASREAALADGSGTATLVFRYTVQDGDLDEDGISVAADALRGGAITDAVGNAAMRAMPPLEAQPGHKVDGIDPPFVREDGVRFKDTPANSTYALGEVIELLITFSKVVHVSGQPSLALSIGPNVRQARYASGSGTAMLVFRYTVQAGDVDDDGISIGPGPASLAGGAIRDDGGNPARRDFAALPANRLHKVDGVAPAIGSAPAVSSAPRGDAYRIGEVIELRVAFDDEVRATGNPTIALRVGTTSREAAFAGGSGTDTLVFRYTVQEGDLDEDGISVAADALRGGAITDAVGNAAMRAMPPLEAQTGHKVDGVVATASVAIASSPASGDTYRADEDINIAVTFSEPVEVAAQSGLTLALTVGAAAREAAFVRRNEDLRTLAFRYTVAYGDIDADGVSVQGDAITGGTVTDVAGNPVRRALALADQAGHKVDTSVTLELAGITLQVGGSPLQLNLADVLAYSGLYNQPVSSDANVAVAQVSGHRLTISPVAEGNAVVTVTAQTTAQIVLNIPVSVTASPAEVAVLKQTLAALGRGVLASAAHTIGTRLELGPGQRRMSLLVGGRRFDPQARDAEPVTLPPSTGLGRADHRHRLGGDWNVGATAPGGAAAWPQGRGDAMPSPFGGGFGSGRMWRDTAFEMPLLGVGRGGSWSLWGGGDFSAFSGEPEENAYDGSLSAAYVGMDGRGPGWVAGGAVGRVSGEASYEYKDATSAGKGDLETALTTFHPYVGWSPSEKAKAWVILGVGRGEASMRRDGQQYDATPTDLSMRMGLVGARGVIGDPGGFDIAVRADAGTLSLETGEGAKAIDALAVAVQRARLGVEMSYTADRGPVVGGVRLSGAGGGAGAFTPFLELAARFDGGDDQSGTGAEVAAGVRYQSQAVSFEAKARTLAMHGAEGYSETGGSATLVVAPNGAGGRGLRLSVSPRWGGAAEATDVFFRRDYAAQAAQRRNASAAYAEWRANARVEYGMPLRGRAGMVVPFAETDVSGARGKRARLGFSYQTKARHGAPVRFQVSGERVQDARGVEHRLLVGAEGRF